MGRKRTPGLVKRKALWYVDKRIGGRRVCQSTQTTELGEAEQFLARLIDSDRQARIYGVRPARTFEQAAAKYLLESQHKRSLNADIGRLKGLIPFIGDTRLDRLHMGVLLPYIESRRSDDVTAGTINHGLKVVRQIPNLAAGEWVDEYGLTWLAAAPKIKMLPDRNKRLPYPLTWDEQTRLFQRLPAHLAQMALFAVNTGCRDSEICGLKWQWEQRLPHLQTSVFVIPSQFVKNGDDRLVILNRVALSVVDAMRGKHSTHVFTFQGKPVARMLNGAWLRARKAVELPSVRVHDLKHTYGARLREAGVGLEDRQDLLGHRSGRITTHYSAPELSKLLEMSNRASERHRAGIEHLVPRRINVS